MVAEHERDRLMTLIDGMAQAVWVSDVEGRVVLANAVARSQAAQVGLDENDLRNVRNMSFKMAAVDGKPLDMESLISASRNEALHGLEIMVRNIKTGEPFYRRLSVSPIFNRKNHLEGRIAIVQDITAEKKAEEERSRLEEQLRQAQKMEAIGTLAGGIAHDFNNMLAIIMGNAELTMDDLENSPEPRRNVEQIVKASKRASDLVKQILAFSRKTAAGKNTLMLTPLIKETCKLLRSTVPTTIKMELDFHARNDTILGDPAQIQQVLMNLATNAVYEMRERGGTLMIALSDLAFLRQDTMPDADMKPGRYVKLSVKDTGDGMTEEVQKRVFEPFFTTKGAGLGTGMGLAVVYGIVKNHGGAVTLVSNPGEGAVFTIFLPFFDAVIEEEPETISEVPHGSERILLVDDEPQVVATVSQTLRRLGYKVVGNTNSRKALNTFINHPERFDLVITDQAMPELTGVDLARNMLEVRKDLPIVLITGYSEAVSPEKAKSAGISGFVMKPLVKRELAETVRRTLDSRGGGSAASK